MKKRWTKLLVGVLLCSFLLQPFFTRAEELSQQELLQEELSQEEFLQEEPPPEELPQEEAPPEEAADDPLLSLYDTEDGLVVFADTLPYAMAREAEAEQDQISLFANSGYTPSPVGSINYVSGIQINHEVRWTGMDAWWPKKNGLITFSADWSRFYATSISQLQPGDIIEWKNDKQYGGLYTNHIAVITYVAEDYSYFITADGNAGGTTGIQFLYHYDMTKARSSCGKANIWRNAQKGSIIAESVRIFTLRIINNNDKSMYNYYWKKLGINWCYCFVVEALLQVNINGKYYDTPVMKSCKSAADGILVSWEEVQGAEQYKLYYKEAGADSWTRLLTTEKKKYLFTGAQPGRVYFFSVKATGEYGDSNKDKKGAGGTLLAGTKAKVKKQNKAVRISWHAVEKAKGYRVYRETGDGIWIKVGDTKELSLKDTAFKEGCVNHYIVRAFATYDGKIYPGYQDKELLSASVDIPAVPTITSAASAAKKIGLAWKEVPGAQRYIVYRKAPGQSWTELAATGKTSFQDKTVTAGVKYVYSVSAVNETGVESDHYVKTAAVIYVPPTKLKKFKYVKGGLQLTWKKVSTASAYRVYRRTPGGSWKRIKTVKYGTSCVDKKGKNGAVYEYLVRAVSKKGTTVSLSSKDQDYVSKHKYKK